MPSPSLVKAQPFSLNDYFPGAERKPALRFFQRCLETVSGLAFLQNRYHFLPETGSAHHFIDEALKNLSITYCIGSGQASSIPGCGAAIIVANHPFGCIDGLILAHLLTGIRRDVKVLANYHLKRIPGMHDLIYGIDPFETRNAWKRNAGALRDSLRLLQQGGLLVVFPAGEVSHYRFSQRRIDDPPWSETVSRLVTLTGVPVVPVYFEGHNSLQFNLVGMLHPLLRTLLLPRELIRKANSCITLRIGKLIPFGKLKKLNDPAAITRYLRLRTYMLKSVRVDPVTFNTVVAATDMAYDPIIDAVPPELLSAEIAALAASQKLYVAGNMEVYIARAVQVPWVLQEIGRLREMTFRLAGEGTGSSIDLDRFDCYYRHLFLWDREKKRIAGAYRLGIVDEILSRHGAKGLYTNSLFKYRTQLLLELGPALELGRSFIREEYQRSYASLNLLWKGIARFVAVNRLPVLFGPVSISRDYSLVSRKLIVDCLQLNHQGSHLARRVKPRRPFRANVKSYWSRSDLVIMKDIELISDMVSQMEKDEKGLPVLVRQYLKLGGKFLGFNVDDEFSDVVDSLIVVDLRMTEGRTLEKYMGKERAAKFLGIDMEPSTEAIVS